MCYKVRMVPPLDPDTAAGPDRHAERNAVQAARARVFCAALLLTPDDLLAAIADVADTHLHPASESADTHAWQIVSAAIGRTEQKLKRYRRART
jgi:hypothetical protein